MDDGGIISSHSGVSAFTGDPYVSLRWGKNSGQMTPEEAEQHGLGVIATAMAARIDAAVFAELTETLGVDKRHAAQFINNLRKRLETGSPGLG